MSDDSTLNAVLFLTKKFDKQVRLNEQSFQEQEDKINLLDNSSQWFSRGRGRWPIKVVSDYFSGNSRLAFGKFSGNLKINGKPCKNDFGLIS